MPHGKSTRCRLPIRAINFSDPADKSRHDNIVSLVEQMLTAKEKLATAKSDADVNRLELQCEGLDRQIDDAVYELYGLTEEERRIVEGAHNARAQGSQVTPPCPPLKEGRSVKQVFPQSVCVDFVMEKAMTRIFNHKTQKPRRQQLRNNATSAERLLWRYLKGSQVAGVKFRRQHGVGPYIMDFFSHECMLAIEVDGATHSSAAEIEHDRKRGRSIDSQGIRTIRFTNDEVYKNLDGVLLSIQVEEERKIIEGANPQRKENNQ